MSAKKQPLGPLQEKWLKMLESGKYKQGEVLLYDGNAYDALGVACLAMGLKLTKPRGDNYCYTFDGRDCGLPYSMRQMKFRSPWGHSLESGPLMGLSIAALNDGTNEIAPRTFKQIAAIVRRDPRQFFKGAA